MASRLQPVELERKRDFSCRRKWIYGRIIGGWGADDACDGVATRIVEAHSYVYLHMHMSMGVLCDLVRFGSTVAQHSGRKRRKPSDEALTPCYQYMYILSRSTQLT